MMYNNTTVHCSYKMERRPFGYHRRLSINRRLMETMAAGSCKFPTMYIRIYLQVYNGNDAHKNSLATEVSMQEAVEVVHGHLHGRRVPTHAVGWRLQALLDSLAESDVFYLYLFAVF